MHHRAIDHALAFIYWLLIIIYLQFWHKRRSGIHKQPPEMFLKSLLISQENACVGVSKLQPFRVATYLKKDPSTGVFLWNLRNSDQHLFWRKSERLLLCIDTLVQSRKCITTLLFVNNIDLFIKIQVLYILCYCCYLFILLIKWILQKFYDFQRRETLATNWTVENNKKSKGRKFRGEPWSR